MSTSGQIHKVLFNFHLDSLDMSALHIMRICFDRLLLTGLRGSAHVSRVSLVRPQLAMHLAMKHGSKELSAFLWS